jgi:hypothetical protein
VAIKQIHVIARIWAMPSEKIRPVLRNIYRFASPIHAGLQDAS